MDFTRQLAEELKINPTRKQLEDHIFIIDAERDLDAGAVCYLNPYIVFGLINHLLRKGLIGPPYNAKSELDYARFRAKVERFLNWRVMSDEEAMKWSVSIKDIAAEMREARMARERTGGEDSGMGETQGWNWWWGLLYEFTSSFVP